MFEDLTEKNVSKVPENNINDVGVKQINDDSKEYSTDTFMFNTRDFEGIENLKEGLKKTNLFIKILIFILAFAIVCIGIYIVKKFFIS